MAPEPEGAAGRHRRRKELFLAAVELPASEREAFLAASCADDAELAREVQAMLDSETTVGRPVPGRPGAAAPVVGEAQQLVRGERSYRRLAELGRGGMGVVYLAERADGDFTQRVALKVLRGGQLVGDTLRQRFRAERQILARLEHPHIARLLDGGEDRDGAPFLVMEYVEGQPIDRHCDQHGLDVEARLRLFRKVCLAVQAAHQHLIVHRDLKPSNILVTAAGEPKLLDFGIAKLLDPGAADWTVAETRLGEQPLTPRYASPEQVQGEPITTATDVFALGVVLYELLTGLSPYAEGLPPLRLARAICEDEPEAPSTAVTRARGSTATPAAGAGVVGRGRLLRGDLDAIVLKALRKDPADRYASAEQLAADVDRHLAGLPVLARAGGLRYRSAKFVRRHWLGLGVAAAFAALVAVFAIDRQVQLDRTGAERDKARAAVEFLVDLFELADPSEARGNSITVREAVDRGATRIERELAGQPETQATLLEAVGRVYHNLGLYPPAKAALGRAVALRRQGAGGALELATALEYLARPIQAAGDPAASEALLREAVALVPASADRAAHATLLATLARLVVDQGRFAEGRDLQRDAYRQLAAAGAASELDLAESATAWVIAIQASADGTDSKEQIAVAARHLARAADSDPVRQAMVRGELAIARRGVGDLELAMTELDRALAGLEAVVPGSHHELANLLNNRAVVRVSVGDYAGAIADLERSRTMWMELVGESHPRTALATANLGTLAKRRGDWWRAKELLEQGLALGRATLAPTHPDLGKDYVSLAEVELEIGNPTAAEALLELARPIVEQEAAPLTLAQFHARRSYHLLRRGDLVAAESLAREALARVEAATGADAPELVPFMVVLGRTQLERGRIAESREVLERALELRSRNPPSRGETALPESLLGRALVAGGGDLGRATGLLETALAAQDRLLLPSHYARAETRLWLAIALARQGQRERAGTLLDEAIAGLDGAFPSGHPLLAPLRRARRDLAAGAG